ncbi:MAG: hypothetical protein PUC59_08395 [Firmicutes bacterium]|nr:hypothetical protein [Bacillota bacterium]
MNRIENNTRPFSAYSPSETYLPQPVRSSETRWFAWSVVFGAAVLLGSVLLGFLMHDGRILLPPGSVTQPGSRENPVSTGGKCTIESLEKDMDGSYFHCRSIWALQQVLRGQEAFDCLSEKIENLPEPENGMEYLVLQFSVTLLNASGRADVQFSTRYFDAVDDSGSETIEWVSSLPETLPFVAVDQSVDGMLAMQVQKGDVPLLFYQAAKDKYYYFRAE